MSCVYAFFSTCLASCVAIAQWFCVWVCIHNHFFVLLLLFLRIQYISLVRCVVIRMTLLICLPSFSIYMFIILIPAYMYRHQYTHLPPLPYSYTFIAIFMCIVCVMFCIYTHVFVLFFFFRNLIDTCVTVSIDESYPYSYPNPLIPSVFPLCNLYIHFVKIKYQNLLLLKITNEYIAT